MSVNKDKPYYYYVVHSPVGFTNPAETSAKIARVYNMCQSWCSSGRTIMLLIGLNTSDKIASLEGMKVFAKQYANRKGMAVVPYRWTCVKEGEVNYIDIRNRLYNCDESQMAIQHCIGTAAQSEKPCSVKLLTIDPDSVFCAAQLTQAEASWESCALPPCVSTGLYNLTMLECALINNDRSLDWRGVVAETAGACDLMGKRMIAQTPLIRYTPLPTNLDPARQAKDLGVLEATAKANILTLEKLIKLSPGQRDLESLGKTRRLLEGLTHLVDMIAKLRTGDDDYKAKAPEEFARHMEIILTLEAAVLPRLNIYLNSENGCCTASSFMYPTEPVMVVSLYDRVKQGGINIFKLMEKNPWGKGSGRSEGEHMLGTISQVWQQHHKAIPRQLLSICLEFDTEIPSRILQMDDTAGLPLSLESLVQSYESNVGFDPNLLRLLVAKANDKSQSCLMPGYSVMRTSYITSQRFPFPRLRKICLEAILPILEKVHQTCGEEGMRLIAAKLLQELFLFSIPEAQATPTQLSQADTEKSMTYLYLLNAILQNTPRPFRILLEYLEDSPSEEAFKAVMQLPKLPRLSQADAEMFETCFYLFNAIIQNKRALRILLGYLGASRS